MKKLVKKLARTETSSICGEKFANMFANCLSCKSRFSASAYDCGASETVADVTACGDA